VVLGLYVDVVKKGNSCITDILYAMITDGNPMRVLAKIFNNLLCIAKGWLAIDNPWLSPDITYKNDESSSK